MRAGGLRQGDGAGEATGLVQLHVEHRVSGGQSLKLRVSRLRCHGVVSGCCGPVRQHPGSHAEIPMRAFVGAEGNGGLPGRQGVIVGGGQGLLYQLNAQFRSRRRHFAQRVHTPALVGIGDEARRGRGAAHRLQPLDAFAGGSAQFHL